MVLVHCQHLNRIFPQKIVHYLHNLFRDGKERGKKKQQKKTLSTLCTHLIPQKINHSSFFLLWLSTSSLVLIVCVFLQSQLMLSEAVWEEKCPISSAGRCRVDLCNLCWLCRFVRESAAVCSALLGTEEQRSWIWFWIMLK